MSPIRPVAEVVLEHIESVVIACSGNMTKSAKALGIDRRTLYRYAKRSTRLQEQLSSLRASAPRAEHVCSVCAARAASEAAE